MKRLLGLLLVMGIVGCGDPVDKLEQFGAKIERNEQEEVIAVSLHNTQITDVGLAHLKRHLKRLPNLMLLDLRNTQITDAGLVHLKGMTNLLLINVIDTQVTPAGYLELQKALPYCEIYHGPS